MIFVSNISVALNRNSVTAIMKTVTCFFPTRVHVKGQRRNHSDDNYLKCYSILGVSVSSDQETVRTAFLNLVKKYHPDSGSLEASEAKFHEHTAPQHRQYLSYGGYGLGTQQQREKQYQRKRAQTAIQNVYKHRISKVASGEEQTLIIKDKKEAKKIKTRSEIERLVEDLIQESMARGDFDNLSGSGKPLKQQNTNPYVDFVTQKMNEVLIDNGFTPEWITLQKEIMKEINDLRQHLAQKRMELGPEPLGIEETSVWERQLKEINARVQQLNKKINNFNLQVPLLNKQMLFFQLDREAAKVLISGKTKLDVPTPPVSIKNEDNTNDFSITGFIEMLLSKKN